MAVAPLVQPCLVVTVGPVGFVGGWSPSFHPPRLEQQRSIAKAKELKVQLMRVAREVSGVGGVGVSLVTDIWGDIGLWLVIDVVT